MSTKAQKKKSELEFHPYADIFPLLEKEELQELAEDIKTHGLHTPIVVCDGKILDGRNRKLACEIVDYDPAPEDYDTYDGGDPLGYVLSLNLHRRHLNESQRAMVAASIANMKQGERTDVKPSANLQNVSQANAAKRLKVSTRNVSTATKVLDKGSPEVANAVTQGKVSLNKASKVIDLPRKDQEKALNDLGNKKSVPKADMDELFTPEDYIKAVKKVMGDIDLDPASCEEANKVIQASQIFTKNDDGLGQEWRGKIWINPPCSNGAAPRFAKKFVRECKNKNCTEGIVLFQNSTYTAWFQDLLQISGALCLTKGRIEFGCGDETVSFPDGQVFFYFGKNIKKFTNEFSKYGVIVVPERKETKQQKTVH